MIRNVLSCVLILISLQFQVSLAHHTPEKCVRAEPVQRPKVTIELLVVCDEEFSEEFHNDRQKMLDFWTANLWDMNMRFKTLSRVDITLRLTSLIEIKTSGNHYINLTKNENGTADFDEMLFEFADWVHQNEVVLPEFDVAVLATSIKNDITYSDDGHYTESICKNNLSRKRHYSTIVANYESMMGNYKCNRLTRSLARLMGTPWDSSSMEYTGCKDNSYILGDEECNEKQFFFSECSDEAILYNVKQNTSACLWNNSDSAVDILEHRIGSVKLPSLLEQCQKLTNDSNATVVNNESKCVSTKCAVTVGGTQMVAKTFYPVDNSPCDTGKYCFRGRCLPQGYLLSNVGSGSCLHSNDRFASDDNVILETCIKSPTPLDQFIVSKNDKVGVHLATPYSSPSGKENADKCLSADEDDHLLRYKNCTSSDKEDLDWMLVKVEIDDGGSFLLYHQSTKSCAKAEPDNVISMSKACNQDDSSMRWKFPDIKSIPTEWMTTLYEMKVFQNDNRAVTHRTTTAVPVGSAPIRAPEIRYLHVPTTEAPVQIIESSGCQAHTIFTTVVITMVISFIVGFFIARCFYIGNSNLSCIQLGAKISQGFRPQKSPTVPFQRDTLSVQCNQL